MPSSAMLAIVMYNLHTVPQTHTRHVLSFVVVLTFVVALATVIYVLCVYDTHKESQPLIKLQGVGVGSMSVVTQSQTHSHAFSNRLCPCQCSTLCAAVSRRVSADGLPYSIAAAVSLLLLYSEATLDTRELSLLQPACSHALPPFHIAVFKM